MKTNRQLRYLLEQERMEGYFNSRIGEFFPEAVKLTDLKIEECRTFSDLTAAVKYTLKTENHLGEEITYKVRGSASSENDSVNARAKAYRLMVDLYDNEKFRSNLTLPKPLFFDKKFGLLLYLEVSGNTLRHLLRADANNEGKIEFVKITAEWLANLHSFDYVLKEKQDEEFLQTKMAVFKDAFFRHWQKKYSEIEKLLDKIMEERLLVHNPNLLALCHGDFTPGNILIQRRHNLVAVIDFIDAAMADPTYDIAVFLVQIEDLKLRNYLYGDQAKKLKNVFLENYLKKTSGNGSGFNQRININQAFSAMQVLKFTVETATENPINEDWLADRLLEYAQKCINERKEVII